MSICCWLLRIAIAITTTMLLIKIIYADLYPPPRENHSGTPIASSHGPQATAERPYHMQYETTLAHVRNLRGVKSNRRDKAIEGLESSSPRRRLLGHRPFLGPRMTAARMVGWRTLLKGPITWHSISLYLLFATVVAMIQAEMFWCLKLCIEDGGIGGRRGDRLGKPKRHSRAGQLRRHRSEGKPVAV